MFAGTSSAVLTALLHRLSTLVGTVPLLRRVYAALVRPTFSNTLDALRFCALSAFLLSLEAAIPSWPSDRTSSLAASATAASATYINTRIFIQFLASVIRCAIALALAVYATPKRLERAHRFIILAVKRAIRVYIAATTPENDDEGDSCFPTHFQTSQSFERMEKKLHAPSKTYQPSKQEQQKDEANSSSVSQFIAQVQQPPHPNPDIPTRMNGSVSHKARRTCASSKWPENVGAQHMKRELENCNNNQQYYGLGSGQSSNPAETVPSKNDLSSGMKTTIPISIFEPITPETQTRTSNLQVSASSPCDTPFLEHRLVGTHNETQRDQLLLPEYKSQDNEITQDFQKLTPVFQPEPQSQAQLQHQAQLHHRQHPLTKLQPHLGLHPKPLQDRQSQQQDQEQQTVTLLTQPQPNPEPREFRHTITEVEENPQAELHFQLKETAGTLLVPQHNTKTSDFAVYPDTTSTISPMSVSNITVAETMEAAKQVERLNKNIFPAHLGAEGAEEKICTSVTELDGPFPQATLVYTSDEEETDVEDLEIIAPVKETVSAEFLMNAENLSVAEKARALDAWSTAQPKFRDASEITKDYSNLVKGVKSFHFKNEHDADVVKSDPYTHNAIRPSKDKVSARFVDEGDDGLDNGDKIMPVSAKVRALQAYVEEQPKFRPAKQPISRRHSAAASFLSRQN